MFKLKKLELENWCQHQHKVVEFTPGTNGIIGANGRGKSNILAAAFTLLTGKTLSDTLSDVVNNDSDNTKNTLEFSMDSVEGKVTRKITATRIDGNHNNRDTVKSTAKLTLDTEVIKGISAVNARLSDVAGLDPVLLQTHVFITQDTMSELLFQSPQERLKSFMALIPELPRAEKIRTSLLAEQGNYPDVVLAVSSKEYMERLTDHYKKRSAMEVERNTQAALLATLDVKQAEKVMAAHRMSEAVNMSALQASLEHANNEADNILVQTASNDILTRELREELEAEPVKVDELASNLATAVANKQLTTNYVAAQARMAELVTEIDTLTTTQPVNKTTLPAAELAKLVEKMTALTGEIQSMDKVVSVLLKGGECPTCGNTFKDPAAHMEEIKNQRLVLEQELAVVKTTISAETLAKTTFEREISDRANRLASIEQQIRSLQPNLVAPEGVTMTDDEIRAAQSKLQICRAKAEQLRKAEMDAVGIKAAYDSCEKRVEDLNARIAEAEKLMEIRPSAEEVKNASEIMQQYDIARGTLARLEGVLEGTNQIIASIEASLAEAEEAEERMERVIKYKDMLNSARAVLHREQLPAEVLASYVGNLEATCNKFLDMFGNPFAIMIDRDMDIRCIMPNGYISSARRLSSGQKCVLSVAMRFAINELFAGNFGLIILDEPTAFMDTDNIGYMRELISYIRSVGQTTGVQTIIITHHEELIASFDNVIAV